MRYQLLRKTEGHANRWNMPDSQLAKVETVQGGRGGAAGCGVHICNPSVRDRGRPSLSWRPDKAHIESETLSQNLVSNVYQIRNLPLSFP